MARRAVSVTLEESNLTWLRGRARVTSGGNLSATIDRLITEARTGGVTRTVRSAVGLATLPADDPDFSKAEAAVRQWFEQSLSRPVFVREDSPPYAAREAKTRRQRAGKRRG